MIIAKEVARQIHLAGITTTVDKIEEPDECMGVDGLVQVTPSVHVQVGMYYSGVVVENGDGTMTFHEMHDGPDHLDKTIGDLKIVMGVYPLCEAVQEALCEYHHEDPEDYDGPLGLVLAAYDCKEGGCVDGSVFGFEELEQQIIKKFKIALYGILEAQNRGYSRVIVEPSYEDTTAYIVLDEFGEILVNSHCKAWKFGHQGGGPEELERFFQSLVREIKD